MDFVWLAYFISGITVGTNNIGLGREPWEVARIEFFKPDHIFIGSNLSLVFIVIACYPAKKTLPDGRNVHLSIKTVDEWKKIIKEIRIKYKKISPYVICSTNRNSFVTVS